VRALAAILVVVIAASAAAYRVVNIGVTTTDGATGVMVVTDEKPVVRHLVIDDPPRLVVDLIGATSGLPRRDFFNIDVSIVEGIRTSRFSKEPDVVRVVVDLKKRVRYAARETETGVVFGLSTPSVAAGSDWAVVMSDWPNQRAAVPLVGQGSASPPVTVPEATPPDVEVPRAVETTRVSVPSSPPAHPPDVPVVTEQPGVAEGDRDTIDPDAGAVASIFGVIPSRVVRVDLQPADTAGPGAPVTLESYPKREIVVYNEGGRRDPFAPLDATVQVEFGVLPPPSVEGLTLVGILEDYGGNRALCEDRQGFGYILRSGDRVQNGYVVQVQKDRVIFNIQEYGWQRTVALELSGL
jgi:hypothetical protein